MYQKYLKYKSKYLRLKSLQSGGSDSQGDIVKMLYNKKKDIGVVKVFDLEHDDDGGITIRVVAKGTDRAIYGYQRSSIKLQQNATLASIYEYENDKQVYVDFINPDGTLATIVFNN